MVCISKEKVDVVTNVTAVVVKMIDNVCGILQFAYGGGSAKAFFNAKTLFKDGWNYTGDPMLLPRKALDVGVICQLVIFFSLSHGV